MSTTEDDPVTYGDVPLIDPTTGKLPDKYAPPSVAANTAVAQEAAETATTMAGQTVALQDAAVAAIARDTSSQTRGVIDWVSASAGSQAAVQRLADQPELISAAAALAQSDAGLVRTAETTAKDVFSVRFADGEPFLEADEERGVFSKITFPENSLGPSATTFVEEIPDAYGWEWVFCGNDHRAIFGKRTDGTWYGLPDVLGQPLPIALVGDSLTKGWSDALVPRVELAQALSRDVAVYGVSGQTSRQVSARVGADPALVNVEGGVIPASGPVAVTVSVAIGQGSWGVSLNGVLGTLTLDSPTATAATFTRQTAGGVWAVPDGTPLVVDPQARDSILVLGSGRNNVYNQDQVVTSHRAILSYWRHSEDALICDVPPWVTEPIGSSGRTALDALNVRLASEFPTHWVTPYAWLRTQGAFDAIGLTPTTQDQDDMSAGITPVSFRSENVQGHLNRNGYRALVAYFTQTITSRGI